MKIPFNKPFLTGKETAYIEQAVNQGQLSGNGPFTKKCQQFFETRYGFKKALLTTSCTDALEMCALLLEGNPGDEIIVPSYTFVSSALAFERQGFTIKFADSQKQHPNVCASSIAAQITAKTRAIVVVHYAGVAVELDEIKRLATEQNLVLIEDAAQAIDSFYIWNGKKYPLGSLGDLATFSFHETKNIIAGEGGLLAINNEQYIEKAEIIWEKGTDRASFFRGEIDKYGWVDLGSSFLPSEVIAAFLYAQLENLDEIQAKRLLIWQRYFMGLQELSKIDKNILPKLPVFATNNAHMFYLVCQDEQSRTDLIHFLKANGIHAVFHYQSLHKSKYYLNKYDERPELPQSDKYTANLVRLPFYYSLSETDQNYIIEKVLEFFQK
ncbi:dTDP-4-amino-4,6-dideoxygalactose transaminase [Mesonia sediminis]|uniref:dTDP-4-amino-4,6-dideoxygalactose transaminase n=1 Tax=Mesonia sediminis TaxID=1703946 RepID=A0ABW5SFP9_9FLAO